MKSNLNPEKDRDAIDAILADEEELISSSGFLAATMERVRDEAACPKPIPFPWLCLELCWRPRLLAGADLRWCVWVWPVRARFRLRNCMWKPQTGVCWNRRDG